MKKLVVKGGSGNGRNMRVERAASACRYDFLDAVESGHVGDGEPKFPE